MNSPKLGSTPVKRLGIARRKSSPVVKSLLKNTILTSIPSPSRVNTVPNSFLTPSKLLKSLEELENVCPNNPDNRGLEVNLEVQQFSELENKLRSLENVSELDESIKMWRVGCKEALLALQALLKEKEDIKMSCKTLSKKLGIWPVIKDNYHADSEVVSSDEDDNY